MNNENRMEQHYAVSKGGVLVHINEAHGSKEDCFCPHCGRRMLKRCGNIRTWHFAHDYRYENEVNKECSYESYLHAFAKLRLKQWFEESTSLTLHYQQPISCQFVKDCIWRKYGDECSRLDEKSIDLKKHLTCCSVEETIHTDDAMFRADLLWSNPDNPKNDILVEIKVTHDCTQKKKESQKRIIEFEVHSEEDVENIVANDIQESDTVKFYGFSPKEEIDEAMQARYSLSKFIYYRTGKAFARSACDCKTFRNRKRCSLLEVTIKDGNPEVFSFGRFYIWELAFAKSKGCDVRNCYLCNHHHYDNDEKKLTCDLNPNEPCEALHAISCNSYKLEEDFFHKNLDNFIKFSQDNLVNVWLKYDN
nr:competence protein CoiA family protein [uncultured Prevotella sp.]